MNARALAYSDDLVSSYWFIPSVMTVGAVVLSVIMTKVDGLVGADWIENASWLYANKADGARTLLSTVAGSMIGVAGVTFSITIASVVYASGQYGPRLLTNFMSDRGNQITLGTFIAFPERIGEGAPGEEARKADEVRAAMPENFFEEAEAIKANGSGYIVGIDSGALLHLASEQDLLLRIRRRPGDFVSPGDPLVLAWPSTRLGDDSRRRLVLAFAWGRQRTARQDTGFLLNELVEIAARALSPGVNDPFTAMGCLDWLGGGLKRLAKRDIPSANRYDEDGTLRIIAEPTFFEEFVEHVFAQLRPYLAADRNAALHAFEVISEVARRVAREERQAALRHEADALLEGAEAGLLVEADKEAIRARHRMVVRLLSGHESPEAIATRSSSVGGTA